MGSGARLALYLARCVIALASVLVLTFTTYAYVTFRNVNADVVTTDVIAPEVKQAGPKPLDGAQDILLVGLDSRDDAYGNPLPKEVMDILHAGINDGERNTDTMILLHIPTDGRRAVAISFPRDTLVEVAGGFGKHKLNSAFVYQFNDTMKSQKNVPKKQAEEKAKQEGRKNLIATIETLIGKAVTIDRYAEVNLASFYEITRAIGGVEVCLNKPVDEYRSGAKFPAGRQTIEGAAALSFVRQRYELPDGDLDRIVRQQVFIGALAHKVLSTGVLTDMGKLGDLVTAIKKSVVLSTGWDITTFAQQMQGLSSGAIDFYTIPTLGPAKFGGADVIKVDTKQVNEFVSGLTRDERTSPSSSNQPTTTPQPTTSANVPPNSDTKITVDVRNASNSKGLASAVQNILSGKGFLPGVVGDATQQQRTSTMFYRPGEQAYAERVTTELGTQFKLTADATLKPGQVRAILGQDFPSDMARVLSGQSTGPVAQGRPTSPSGSLSPSGQQPPKPSINADGVTCVN
ncbi:LCP family protein required for cell wall assembly [Kibdelosporangium banguiense]|uniref:LCP family protein required for cell wall assembly n=1 Tax=Kibdelosporangium banguiense TaxID=1365924 RepID=A0ABS4TEJ6_9PSEU|nr:LCP family protein [Kibdelosporangium banguiense]MBP2322829.1 LCP family protein required for cell wall assembly [Kibdelosporangium banguiense]